MTNNQHGQVPAIQRYKIGYHSDEWGVRSLSPTGIYDDAGPWVRYEDHAAVITALRTQQPASPTPPAEQQATKETSGGFHVWRDISTAPKDGSRFVATGHNYGLYSEGRHACVAQWFRGSWIEASEWNEASELTYLTHWMPLPSPPDDVAAPAEQQAAPRAAPTDREQAAQRLRELADISQDDVTNPLHPRYIAGYKAGHAAGRKRAEPQQEAQEPCPTCVALARTVMLDQVSFDRKPDCYGIRQITDDESVEEWEDIRTSPDVAREEANDMMATGRGEIYEVVPLWTTPQPAPGCHHRPPCAECAARARLGEKT